MQGDTEFEVSRHFAGTHLGEESMTEDMEKKLADTYELMALAYTRAAEAYQIATNAYRAAVMAYELAVGATDSNQFDPPPSEPAQPPPDFSI